MNPTPPSAIPNAGVLAVEDFAKLFGTTVEGIPADCVEAIRGHDFGFRALEGAERDEVLLEVFKRVDSGALSLAGPSGQPRWEKGWGENLAEFANSGTDMARLVPKYIRSGLPLRLHQRFIRTTDPDFELNWYRVFRGWLFTTYLSGFDHIFEFGCGSGYNLVALAKIYPHTRIVGLDWSPASCEIAEALRRSCGLRTEGRLFDFFKPDMSVDIPDNSAALTIGAVEQTGLEHARFFEFLAAKKPRLCIHVEPVVEWYDENDIVDYSGIRFMHVRNYLRGLPDTIGQLVANGRAEIIKAKRSYFGSQFIEGYSYIVWRVV